MLKNKILCVKVSLVYQFESLLGPWQRQTSWNIGACNILSAIIKVCNFRWVNLCRIVLVNIGLMINI